MTLEKRLDDLMANLPYLHKTSGGVKGFRNRLRLALLDVARDQRHACAEAVAAMPRTPHNEPGDCVWKDEAHQEVMNANLLDSPSLLEKVARGAEAIERRLQRLTASMASPTGE